MATPHISVTLPNNASTLALGTIFNTSPTLPPSPILLTNHTPHPQTLTLTLSDSLHPHLTLLHSLNPQPPPAPNQNLLHHNPVPALLHHLPPSTAHTLRLHLAPLPASPAHRHPPRVPFSGSLHVRAQPAAQLISLPIAGAAVAALLSVHPSRLHFAHCTPSDWAYLPLLIRNLSPAPTAFSLSPGINTHADPVTASLRFVQADTGAQLSKSTIPLHAGEALSVRVGLRPGKAGKLRRWIAVNDVHNPANVGYVRVDADARAERVAQSIQVNCGFQLDFGLCYAGCVVYRDVEVTSTCTEDVSVALVADRSHHVAFELLEWLGEEEEGDGESVGGGSVDGGRNNRKADKGSLESLPSAELGQHERDWLVRNHSSSLFGQKQVTLADGVEQVPKKRPAESVMLTPGQKRCVRVWYLPAVTVERDDGTGHASRLDRGRLREEEFQMNFNLPSGEGQTVMGRARVCESILKLERDEVHLGHCNVLTRYKAVMSIINCSDLPATVDLNFVSLCVFVAVREATIKPRQAFDVRLDFVPRQVNPNYHKEFTVTNRQNPNMANLMFTLRANCVDRQGISLHALFYKVLAPNPTNEIDFGLTVANHPAIRAFRVRNITRSKLTLKFGSGPGVSTYIPSDIEAQTALRDARIQKGKHRRGFSKYDMTSLSSIPYPNAELSRLESLRTINALVDTSVQTRNQTSFRSKHSDANLKPTREGVLFDDVQWYDQKQHCEFLDSSSEGEGSHKDIDESGEHLERGGERTWLEFLKCLDERDFALLDSDPAFFSNYDSEMSYTEKQFRPARRLRAALRDGYLLRTDTVTLSPDAETLIVVSLSLTDHEVRGRTKTRLFEKRLLVQMLEFDKSRLSDAAPTSSRELNQIAKLFEDGHGSKLREILLTVQACKSLMKIAPLRQLNFGAIACGEQRDKAFTIVNLSDAPLFYAIRKDGRDTNDELRFNLGKGTRGVVGPYFSKTVPFIYAPVKEGLFEQRIVVENRLDSSAACQLVVKALVIKPFRACS